MHLPVSDINQEESLGISEQQVLNQGNEVLVSYVRRPQPFLSFDVTCQLVGLCCVISGT